MGLRFTPAAGGPDAKDAFRHAVYKRDTSKRPKADAAEPAIAGEGWSAAGIKVSRLSKNQYSGMPTRTSAEPPNKIKDLEPKSFQEVHDPFLFCTAPAPPL